MRLDLMCLIIIYVITIYYGYDNYVQMIITTIYFFPLIIEKYCVQTSFKIRIKIRFEQFSGI